MKFTSTKKQGENRKQITFISERGRKLDRLCITLHADQYPKGELFTTNMGTNAWREGKLLF